jgi:hypothetical protein
MTRVHLVSQGEHATSIAAHYGFQNYETIWQHPENSWLREKRDPNVLLPGDEIAIPDRIITPATCSSGTIHRFVLASTRLTLRIRLLNSDRSPMVRTSCELHIQDETHSAITDNNGMIELALSSRAREGAIVVGDRTIPMNIGHLDPIEKEPGWQARLINLGYLEPFVDEPDPLELRSALEEFQHDQGLTMTGMPDAVTLSKVQEVHGS